MTKLLTNAQIESHLDSCDECAARLSTLQNLFAELDSLPEQELTRDLAAPFMRTSSLPAQLPKFLTLTVILQSAFALTAIILAAPFVIQVLAFGLSNFSNVWFNYKSMDSLTQYPLAVSKCPPCLPSRLNSSLYLMSALVVASMLWLVGMGCCYEIKFK
ncbi:MAG: hypothetical protein IPL71_22240 [Anaerolineales bacterium]|uniref:anti-sigma factor family protein n=1 Tax=Candidatus Villigracilis proximus TaxID=3140683 RepID=UPI0031359F1E|nr:hypothetical protein [Anaerolineales bacterium]